MDKNKHIDEVVLSHLYYIRDSKHRFISDKNRSPLCRMCSSFAITSPSTPSGWNIRSKPLTHRSGWDTFTEFANQITPFRKSFYKFLFNKDIRVQLVSKLEELFYFSRLYALGKLAEWRLNLNKYYEREWCLISTALQTNELFRSNFILFPTLYFDYHESSSCNLHPNKYLIAVFNLVFRN